MGELVTVETREVLLGARYLPQEEVETEGYHWHLVGDQVSEMWEYTLSDQWAERVNSEHYVDLWGDLLKELNGTEGPVQVTLDAVYEFGMLNQEGVSAYLDNNTGKGPQFLTVFASTDDEMPMSCVWLRAWSIEGIEITTPGASKVSKEAKEKE